MSTQGGWKFWALGPGASVLGVLMIVGSILLKVFKVPGSGFGLMLFFGIVLLIGGITGGVWIRRSNN
ncbi:MAG: hypothetical protein ACMUIU_03665 [bacterium]